MKLTPLGKITIFILFAGLAFGAYRLWSQRTAGPFSAPVAQNSGNDSTSSPDSNGTVQNSPGGNNSNASPASSNPDAATTLELVSSASKRGWLSEMIDGFNAQSDGPKIELRAVETREAMQRIIEGVNNPNSAHALRPALWSPSSVIWADRLAEVAEGKTRGQLLDTTDPELYRVVLRTPMVFLTTREKAKFYRPLLETPKVWSNIRSLSEGKIKAPGGSFKWAHADPLAANSGMLTLALILADYADRTGANNIETVPKSSAFLDYLRSIEKRAVTDSAVKKGSSALTKSFVSDPSRYDFITAYESAALDAVRQNPDLVVIYPRPTINAENSFAFLNWDSLSQAQKESARAFLDYVASPQAAQAALKESFRPARGANLNAQLAEYANNGFKQSYSSIEVPPYAALNQTAYLYATRVKG